MKNRNSLLFRELRKVSGLWVRAIVSCCNGTIKGSRGFVLMTGEWVLREGTGGICGTTCRTICGGAISSWKDCWNWSEVLRWWNDVDASWDEVGGVQKKKLARSWGYASWTRWVGQQPSVVDVARHVAMTLLSSTLFSIGFETVCIMRNAAGSCSLPHLKYCLWNHCKRFCDQYVKQSFSDVNWQTMYWKKCAILIRAPPNVTIGLDTEQRLGERGMCQEECSVIDTKIHQQKRASQT